MGDLKPGTGPGSVPNPAAAPSARVPPLLPIARQLQEGFPRERPKEFLHLLFP